MAESIRIWSGFWERTKQYYMNMSIKHKVFLLISLLMLFFFIFTAVVLQAAFYIYDDNIYDKSSQVLHLTSTGIEKELREIERLSFQLVADEYIQATLATLKSPMTTYELVVQRAGLESRLFAYASAERYIMSINVVDGVGREYSGGSRVHYMGEEQLDVYLPETLTMQGRNKWFYPGEYQDELVGGRLIRSYGNQLSLEHMGFVLTRVNLERIVRDFISGSGIEYGDIMIFADEHLIFPRESELVEKITIPEQGERGYDIVEIDGEKMFLAYTPSEYTNWTYVNVVPFNSIFHNIQTMKNILLVLSLFMFVMVIIGGIKFARNITSPIEGLMEEIKLVEDGRFEEAEKELFGSIPSQQDEVGLLYRNFSMMVHRINELIKENYIKQIAIKETEFKALQAQINPHFLYNTLESINWLAKAEKQNQISQMVESLGFLLRSAVDIKEPLITIVEEKQILLNYARIQQFRFEERLDLHIELPEEVEHVCIPKMTLQPLLENAIHYALEPMVEPCTIRIRADIRQDGLYIEVSDNGPGMSAELLQMVREGQSRTRGKGIGLKNIQERIKYSFGEPYGLQLDSTEGLGTTVSIHLPFEERCLRVQSVAGR